jgi:hypothetical protein
VTNQSATLYFAPAGRPYTSYYVSYGLQSWAEQYGVEFDTWEQQGVIVYSVYALRPNTVYYFKVRAGNGCMPGDWSKTLKIKTTYKGITGKYYENFPARIFGAIRKTTQPIIKPQETPSGSAVQGASTTNYLGNFMDFLFHK